jgi:hypothetical protein
MLWDPFAEHSTLPPWSKGNAVKLFEKTRTEIAQWRELPAQIKEFTYGAAAFILAAVALVLSLVGVILHAS